MLQGAWLPWGWGEGWCGGLQTWQQIKQRNHNSVCSSAPCTHKKAVLPPLHTSQTWQCLVAKRCPSAVVKHQGHATCDVEHAHCSS